VDRDKKRELLTHLIKQHNWFQVLVFTRTKHGANRLAEQLTKDGISALAIHGNKSQSARTRALAEFKDGTLQVLVATDIAARGIDIDQLPHVVNFDLPNVPEDYVHRIGRTGRAGATGEAISLVCVDELQLLKDIEKLIKRPVPQEVIAGFEPDPNAKPEPILRRGQGGGGGGGRSPRQGQGAPKREGTASAKPAQRSGQRPAHGQPKPQGAKPAGANGNGGQPRRDGQRHDDRPRAAAHEGSAAQHAPRKPQGNKPQGGNPGALLGGAKPRNDAPRGGQPSRSGQRGR
jgi:ATP-dependent RNA helicase RhlE